MNLSNVSKHSLSLRHSWRFAWGLYFVFVSYICSILHRRRRRTKLQFVYVPSTGTHTAGVGDWRFVCESVGNKSNAAAESSTNYGELKVFSKRRHLLLFLRFRCMLHFAVAYCRWSRESEGGSRGRSQSVSQPAVYHLPGTHAFHFSRRQLQCFPSDSDHPQYPILIPQFPVPSSPIPLWFFLALKDAALSFASVAMQFLFMFRFVFIHNFVLGWIWIGKSTGCIQINAKLCLSCCQLHRK